MKHVYNDMPAYDKKYKSRLVYMLMSLLIFVAAGRQQVTAQDFVHPGLLHKQSDFDRMQTKVAAGAQPWKAGWDVLVANSRSSLSTGYANPAPSIIYRGFDGTHTENYATLFTNIASAWQTAIRWKVTGDTAYANRSVAIMNSWSASLTQLSGTSDKFLAAGIYGYQFANAAEIMRSYPGWAAADFARFQNMMLTVFYSMNHDFLVNHNGACISNYWANWDLCNMASMLGIGVLCDRRDIYNEAIDYFKNGAGMGSINNVVPYLYDSLGQWQESGRDQGHTTLGVALAGSFAEMAWNQGDDLYGYDNNRLLKGFEYIAKYNLGYEVPYTTYQNCIGIVQTIISDDGRGAVRPVWEMVYNHYVNRKGLTAPYTALFAQRVRPEGGGGNYGPNSGGYDQLGFGTLTFSLDEPVKPNTQAITFAAVANKNIGDADFSPGATASSGLPIVYSVGDPTIVSVNANGTLHVLKPGTTIIYAQQMGNAQYNAAPIAQQSITVNQIPGTKDGVWSNTAGTVTAALSYVTGSANVKWAGQAFVAGEHIKLTGTVAGGFTANTVYTVVSVNSDSSFQLSLTPGGTVIKATSTITNGTAQRFQKWGAAANWTNTVMPGGLNATADFGATSYSNIPGVTLNDTIKIGTLRYASNGTAELVLGSGINNGSLQFESFSGMPHITMYNTGSRKLFMGYAVNNTRVPLKIKGTQGLAVNTPVYGGGNPAGLRIQAAMDWSGLSGGLVLEQGTIELHNTLNSLTASDNVLLPLQRLKMGTLNTAVMYFTGASYASKQTIGALDGTDAAFIFSKTNITNGTPALVVGADNGDGDFEGTIGMGPVLTNTVDMGRINIEKTGSGTQVLGGSIKNSSLGNNAVILNAGKLILNGANEYAGNTTVNAGTLELNGSGPSPVIVNAGLLNGTGTISGTVTVGTGSGTGATLAPGNSIGTFTTTAALTLNVDATYEPEYNSSTGSFDKVVSNGVTISNATLNLVETGNAVTQPAGSVFTIIDNTGSAAVSGNFNNLPEGAIIDNGVNLLKISYQGGTGNDVVLTVIKLDQAITFDSLQSIGVVSTDVNPGAMASSGLPVSYTSSNINVATIVDGKIHTAGVGTTIITATQDGNYKYNAAPAVSQTLIVFDNIAPSAPQALTSSKMADGKVLLLWQASTDNVGVTGYFVYCNGVLLNGDPVTATSYITTAPSGNTYNVYTVIATDAAGNLSEESPIEIFSNSNSVGGSTSVMDVVKIFPNPNSGNFKVRVNTKETGKIIITVYNAGALAIQTIEDSKMGDVYQKEIKLGCTQPGTYYVKIVVGSFSSIKTVLVQ